MLVAATMLIPALGTVRDGTDGKIAGMHIVPDARGWATLSEIQRIHRTGVNTAAIATWWSVDSPSSTTVHPGRMSVPDPNIEAAITEARALGMRVILYPLLWCEGCAWGWGGLVRPSDIGAFFASYTAYVNHYASIGRELGASIIFLGGEMKSMEPHADRWRTMAAAVRKTFGNGKIGYEANWDSVGSVPFWDTVDIIGCSCYFPLSDATPSPSVSALMADWHHSSNPMFAGRDWFAELHDLAARTHRPILFNEAGYQSYPKAAEYPFSWTSHGKVDQQTQANAMQAMLETFSGQSWWLGVNWWRWEIVNPAADDGYSPRGKKAEQLLTAWYHDDWRP